MLVWHFLRLFEIERLENCKTRGYAMGVYDRIKGMSRRDFFRRTNTYGMSSTLVAAGTFGGAMTAASLARAAEST